MNVFADFQARVGALIEKRIEAGELPHDLDLARFVVEPPRDAAHGDLSTNAAMVYAKEAKAAGSNPRALAERLAADLAAEPDVAKAEVAGPGFINIVLKPEVYEKVLNAVLDAGRSLRRRPSGRRRAGERRICQRQSDRADACRARARRGVRRRAGQPPELRRLSGDARILHQRRRRPGERARPFRLPALPRGARRGDRDPGGALSGRLPQAGRRSAEGGIRRGLERRAGIGVAAARPPARDRRDDGADSRRSRRAQHHPRGVRLRAGADRRRRRSEPGRGGDRRAESQGPHLRGPAAAAQRAGPPTTGRTASRPCSGRPPSATTSTGRWSSRTAATPISPATSPTTRPRSTAAFSPWSTSGAPTMAAMSGGCRPRSRRSPTTGPGSKSACASSCA